MTSTNKKTLGVVFLTVFLDLVGFGIIIPVQAFYAESLGASPTLITILGASYSLMQFIFAPIWGKMSDRVGRRPIMLVSIAIGCVGYLIFGFSNTLWVLFVARMLSGLGAGNIGTAQAIIADSTPPEGRAKGMGLIGAAFGLGFIFGPAIGGSFAQFGLTVPVFIAAGLAAVNWILAYFILPETRFLHPEAPAAGHRGFSWAALKHAARHEGVARIFSLYFYYAVAFSMMEQVLALFVKANWITGKLDLTNDLADKKAAFMTMELLVVVGVVATIVQGGLIGRLVKKFGEKALLTVGMGVVAVTLLVLPSTATLPFYTLLILMAPMAFGTGVINPSISSLLSRSVGKDEQGASLGIGQSLSALGRVFGPAMAGLFYEIHQGLPYWIGGGLMVACTALCLTVKKK